MVYFVASLGTEQLNAATKFFVNKGPPYQRGSGWTLNHFGQLVEVRQGTHAVALSNGTRYSSSEVVRNVSTFGIEELISAPRSTWQNGYLSPVLRTGENAKLCEAAGRLRVIGSRRRDWLDDVIVLGEHY